MLLYVINSIEGLSRQVACFKPLALIEGLLLFQHFLIIEECIQILYASLKHKVGIAPNNFPTFKSINAFEIC